MVWEFINTPININTRLTETENQPAEFEQFFNRRDIPCLTYFKELEVNSRFNGVIYNPTFANIEHSIEIELYNGELEVDLANYDLTDVAEIIIVHMHTSSITVHNLPVEFVESDKFDQELSINFRNKYKDKDRIQFHRIGLVGDDPCITKYVKRDLVK